MLTVTAEATVVCVNTVCTHSFGKQCNASTDYSHCGLPTGSSDDVSRVHSWRRHIGCVEEGAVVGIVLTQGPLSGVLDRLLPFQLENGKHIRQCALYR